MGKAVIQMVLVLVFLLLFRHHTICKTHSTLCTIYDKPIPHEFYQPGHLVFGKIASHIFLYEETPLFVEQPKWTLIGEPISVPKFYQHILALTFAIKEISENPIFPLNLTWGFHILNCYYLPKVTYKATLSLLSTQQRNFPNFKCGISNNLVAVIGGHASEASTIMATILAIYKIPQFIYGTFPPLEGGQLLFPSSYKMVPNEAYQYMGVIRLLHHFRWTWIGLLAVEDDAGDRFLQTVVPLLSQHRICTSFTLRTPKRTYMDMYLDVFATLLEQYPVLLESKANVYFVYGEANLLQILRMVFLTAEMSSLPPLHKVWIVTSQWDFESLSMQRIWDIETFHGAISFAVHSSQPPGFKEFLQGIKPLHREKNGFIQEFWERAFNCSLKNSNAHQESKTTCSGEEKLEDLPGVLFEISMTGHSYNVYNAVYAVAHALQAEYSSESRHGKLVQGGELLSWNIQPWQFHRFLRNIFFNNSAGDTVHFNENGELVEVFDVTNWVTFPNASFVRVKVGRLDPQASPGQELILNDAQIVWHKGFNQTRTKSTIKNKTKLHNPSEDISASSHASLLYDTDMDYCVNCPEDHYSDHHHNQCFPKITVYLSYEEPFGFFLAMLAIASSLITALVFEIIRKHKDTPIVKANNLSLTYILLFALFLCFLCTLQFIGKPGKVSCLFRQTAFGIVFSVALSSVMAKTITVILAFMATNPASQGRTWIMKKIANSIVFACSFIQQLYGKDITVSFLHATFSSNNVVSIRQLL
ncbi:PREDICTED: vomeronasal type-2 receptor 26-like [Gekko japonicus]|uniref:Vomeronasal type-2 receptor 26-like n=1 Tax=Gekko japonicus TaxID=146911 RepID=A0ABM1KGX5_GEKJA|nr:PREDICTED: vomeronasal type-2 receptor 26-like [Gekko japonicus]